jgi:MFS family permease
MIMPSPVADRRVLYATAMLRAITTSTIGITSGAYLATLGLSPGALGAVISCGLAGAALAALTATFTADRIGRRRFLIATAALGVLGTAWFALADSPVALAFAAFVGMVNGMGKDRGAALILEQAALPSTASDRARTRVIAVYTMLQDIGHALGALLAGLPAWLVAQTSLDAAGSHRGVVLGCAACGAIAVALYARLGPEIDGHGTAAEASPDGAGDSSSAETSLDGAGARFADTAPRPAPRAVSRQRLTARSRAILVKISALFALDGLGGGFLTAALVSYFFFERFGASEGAIAVLFFGARLMNAASHLGAAWLARRIGLINTMVFTHMPSSFLLVTVAFAPSFAVAAVLFLLREGLVEMDVPTRQSYVLAVVRPDERTLASGITNLVRLAAWAAAPAFAGLLMTGNRLYVPLVVGAAMKIVYDLLLWRAFRAIRPPEEAG